MWKNLSNLSIKFRLSIYEKNIVSGKKNSHLQVNTNTADIASNNVDISTNNDDIASNALELANLVAQSEYSN